MKLNYLCPAHRTWLFSDNEKVEYYWHIWMDTADYFCQSNAIDQALPYLGYAFELAEYALTQRYPSHATATHRFTYSSLLLAMAYQYQLDTDGQYYIIEQAQKRLEREITASKSTEHVSLCLRQLTINSETTTSSHRVRHSALH
ncbi:MAG: hypothetical protein PUP46_01565 [Endozoicomonas sp. (ex Botrylloides leachii)]|nr:hypothetical protein [Endozoicomonas sp. (ex Botrylloides leachii)]